MFYIIMTTIIVLLSVLMLYGDYYLTEKLNQNYHAKTHIMLMAIKVALLFVLFLGASLSAGFMMMQKGSAYINVTFNSVYDYSLFLFIPVFSLLNYKTYRMYLKNKEFMDRFLYIRRFSLVFLKL